MKERQLINTTVLPPEVMLFHRETPTGEDVVEAWYDEGDQEHTMRYLTEWHRAEVVEVDVFKLEPHTISERKEVER